MSQSQQSWGHWKVLLHSCQRKHTTYKKLQLGYMQNYQQGLKLQTDRYTDRQIKTDNHRIILGRGEA